MFVFFIYILVLVLFCFVDCLTNRCKGKINIYVTEMLFDNVIITKVQTKNEKSQLHNHNRSRDMERSGFNVCGCSNRFIPHC